MLKEQVKNFYDAYHEVRVRTPDQWMRSRYWPLFGDHVLEVGAGTLVPDVELRPRYVVVDLSEQALIRIQPAALMADAEALPVADQAFDTVACYDVLEHICDPLRMLQEMCRVTSRRIIVAGPNYVCDQQGGFDRNALGRLLRWLWTGGGSWHRLSPHLSFDEHWYPDADAITAANSAWVVRTVQESGFYLYMMETWPNRFRMLNHLPIVRHLGEFMLVVAHRKRMP